VELQVLKALQEQPALAVQAVLLELLELSA
jgi:hypothetical protein